MELIFHGVVAGLVVALAVESEHRKAPKYVPAALFVVAGLLLGVALVRAL